jgi:hypothetical protein
MSCQLAMDFQPQVSSHEIFLKVTSSSDKILSLPLRSAVKLQGINQIQAVMFSATGSGGHGQHYEVKDSIVVKTYNPHTCTWEFITTITTI